MEEYITLKKIYVRESSDVKIELVVECQDELISRGKLEAQMDSVFNNMLSFEDVKKIVVWIRTIFQGMKERELTVEATTIKEHTKVIYKDKKLTRVEIENHLQNNARVVLKNVYDADHGICFYLDPSAKLANISIEQYEENSKKVFDTIKEIENIFAIKFSDHDEKICKIYKLFYGENPDFSREDISIRIQTMSCILVEFNISLGYDFDTKLLDNNLQYSLELQCDIDKLAPFGEINIDEEKIKIRESSKRKIKIVGEFVRKYTKDNPDSLIKLSNIIYASRYNLSEIAEPEEVKKIADSSHYSSESIEECIKLIRKLHNQLEKKPE